MAYQIPLLMETLKPLLWPFKKRYNIIPIVHFCLPAVLYCVIQQYALLYYLRVYCPIFLLIDLLTMDLSVGFSFVTSFTTGREAHAGERCQCSTSKKNRGAPEKLTAGFIPFTSGSIFQIIVLKCLKDCLQATIIWNEK